ncbi:hypothetical protein ElyMa_006493200 [Elysia marginata]|uniref:Uncharacterized protein n=1 Tax=Elysia marginata TaxID=1093978 RepID=A0AAV4I486_9GAST|nr:hypothetical protein ElyMa_006493200 [Elysia marginata]
MHKFNYILTDRPFEYDTQSLGLVWTCHQTRQPFQDNSPGQWKASADEDDKGRLGVITYNIKEWTGMAMYELVRSASDRDAWRQKTDSSALRSPRRPHRSRDSVSE